MPNRGDKRIGVSFAGILVSGVLSYIVQQCLGSWGVFDGMSEAAGKYFKAHVSPGVAGWTVALLIFASLYGVILWRVWRPRNIHHVDPATERINFGDHAEAELVPAS